MDFFKYQGTGNDFILLDAREGIPSNLDVKKLCDRRFGIGADGLMLLAQKQGYDFEMIYYNSDGNLSSMCGNGGRCIARFASSLHIGDGKNLHFLATDGPHTAWVEGDYVELGMKDVGVWESRGNDVFLLNTGSPHYVVFTDKDTSSMDLVPFARTIRYNDEFSSQGINVNVVHQTSENAIEMRTYERGVEDETYSCGTGVTASALALQIKNNMAIPEVKVITPGGELKVKSTRHADFFSQIILCGPAVFVFKGSL